MRMMMMMMRFHYTRDAALILVLNFCHITIAYDHEQPVLMDMVLVVTDSQHEDVADVVCGFYTDMTRRSWSS